MFRIGQKVKVVSHSGYEKHEGWNDIKSPWDAPKIGNTYVIAEIDTYSDHEIFFFTHSYRGIYDCDVEDASSKLEKALK